MENKLNIHDDSEKESNDRIEKGGDSVLIGESSTTSGKSGVDFGLLMDLPVTLSMEIGRTEISIKNLLKLAPGAIVELDRQSNDPLDIFVNGKLIARGEVVVVNDKYGIRLIDVVNVSKRLKK